MYCKIIIGILLIVYTSLSSCTLPAYSPNKFHAPLLQEQGNFEVEASFSYNHGFDAGIAYALSDHLGIKAASGFFARHSDDSDYHNLSFFEVGAGVFGIISEKNPWECYVTGTYGTSDISGAESLMSAGHDQVRVKSKYYRIALQSDILVASRPLDKAKKIWHDSFLDAGLGMRLSYVNDVFYEQGTSDSLRTIRPKGFFVEFVTIWKYGAYPFFLEFQLGGTFPVRSPTQLQYVNPAILSIGLNYCLF